MTANIRNISFDLNKEDIGPYGTKDLTKEEGPMARRREDF